MRDAWYKRLCSKSPHAHGGFPIDPRRVAPEILEAVKRAFVPMKNVDNYLQIIEHDPLTGWKAVNRRWSNRAVLSQPGFNFIGDGFELRLRCS